MENFAYTKRLEPRQIALTFRLGTLLIVGDYTNGQLILHPSISVGWFSWELNPQVLRSLSLKVSATSGGSLRLKTSMMGRRAVPLFLIMPWHSPYK
jgi:hypothetical protein